MSRVTFFICVLFSVITPALNAQNTFEYYLEKAKLNSPLIADNKNQSKANQLEAERLKAQYTKAQLNVTANYLFTPIINRDNGDSRFEANSNGAEKYYGYDLAASNGGQYQALLTLTQPLFNTTRYQTFAEQSLIASQVNENNVRLSVHDVEKAVGDQYILCLLDKQQWQFTDSLVQILEGQQAIVKKLTQSGLMKQSDLSLLTIELQGQRNARINFLTTYKRDLLDLNVLCGISDTSFVVLPELNLSLNPDTTTSHFLAKYTLDSLNLRAQQKVFELKYKPVVSAYANGGLNAVYAPTIPSRLGVGAGLSFTWNIFDGHQRNINEQKTNALLRSVSTYKNYFNVQNNVRKERIAKEIQGLDQRLQILQEQLAEYTTLMTYYKKELMQGQLPVINYINVLKTQTASKRDLLILQTNRLLLINLYNYWNW
jgi:outer membrane protein TolC